MPDIPSDAIWRVFGEKGIERRTHMNSFQKAMCQFVDSGGKFITGGLLILTKENKMQAKLNVKKLWRHLKEFGHVYTIERENLLNTIYSMEGTYSLNELFLAARKQDAIHAKSTIYRNLNILLKAGFIKELKSPGKRKKYETNYYSRNGNA